MIICGTKWVDNGVFISDNDRAIYASGECSRPNIKPIPEEMSFVILSVIC